MYSKQGTKWNKWVQNIVQDISLKNTDLWEDIVIENIKYSDCNIAVALNL
jgi:hypothetical protein